MQNFSLQLKTLILSDIHLGTKYCKANEVLDFLEHCSFQKLILNGDIIDGWSLKRKGGWLESHSKVLNKLVSYMEDPSIEVIFLRGNHDEMLDEVLDFPIDKLNMIPEHIHENVHGNYLVTHGDAFDTVAQKHKWLAVLGDIAYQFMMGVNAIYNKYRVWRGKKYFSISKVAKAKVKSIVGSSDNLEAKLIQAAKNANCTGIICGHIHTAIDKHLENIHYLNSGDWVESLSAIAEYPDGHFKILFYNEL
ncbi:MAG: UDP-2,3-diacylglucosamine diphosphatase [Opitutae bacterium]|nr:UDP-2,3-diacylglucosamine diphosphatase [Opitutae bacterium]